VAHVVEQRPSLVLIAFEPLDHRVEATDQLADGAHRAVRDGQTDGVVSGLDSGDRIDQFVQCSGGTSEPTANADENEHDHDDRDDNGQGPIGRERECARSDERSEDQAEDHCEQTPKDARRATPPAIAPFA
jgi:hypothetical protein